MKISFVFEQKNTASDFLLYFFDRPDKRLFFHGKVDKRIRLEVLPRQGRNHAVLMD